MVKSYKDLLVWQKAMDLAEKVYEATRQFPKEEVYGLTSQLRRAAVSVPSNIAEGQARSTSADFMRFLSIARGSLAEVETLLLLARRFQYVNEEQVEAILDLQVEVNKMLNALAQKLAERV